MPGASYEIPKIDQRVGTKTRVLFDIAKQPLKFMVPEKAHLAE